MPEHRSDSPGGLAILYGAKSTEDKRGSIPTQLDHGRAMAEAEGCTVVAEYADENESAWHGNRGPELAAALDHAERIGAAIFVQHSDRLARGDGVQARHLVQLVLEARARGICLRSVEDDGSLENVVMAAVMGERNTEDSRRKSAAVKAGMDRRRKRGQYIGRLFLGSEWVRNEDDEREIRITESGAAIAQRIFGEYLAGNPQRTIARNCHADKVPTQNGGDWHQATVQKILTNPAYAGLVRDGDKLIEATHEGCIDRKTWNDVQRLLAANTRTHGRGRPVAGLHLFRKGFLRCGACGGPLMPRTLREKRDGRVYESYICYSQERDPNCCSASTIKRTDVDNRVFAYFAQVGLDVDATRDRIASAADRKLREAQALLSGAEDEARAARNRLAKIKRDYTHGDLSAADWRELRAELEPDLEAAKAQAERLRAQVADANKNAAVNDAESAVVERLAAIRVSVAGEVKDAKGAAAVRATLMRLFDGFTLHEGIPDRVNAELVGERWLEPHISADAIGGYDEKERLILTKEALETAGEPLENAENNSYVGFVR